MLKQFRPHLISVGLFLLISLAYFSPVLSGKVLVQHDISQWTGMAKEIMDYRETHGDEPLWTSRMFSGMPAYQISVFYPSNLIKYANDFFWLWLPNPANLLFLSLISFYILMIALRTDYRIAIAGAIAYAFVSFNFVSIQAGHNTKVQAIALMPLVFAGVLLAYRERWMLGAALTALGLSMQIYANHLQITYYTAITVGFLVLFEAIRAIREKQLPSYLKSSVALVFAAILAVLPNITNLLLTYEYGKYSTRGQSELTEKKVSAGLDKDYALGWSYGRLETMTLLIPDFSGGSSSKKLDRNSATYKALVSQAGEAQARGFCESAPLYWGDQPMTSGPVYNGAIPFFLFILSLFVLRGPFKWWVILSSLFFIMISWGRHFLPLTDFLFDHFPGYSKFRSVAMALVVTSLMIPLAGLFGLSRFMDSSMDKLKSLNYLKLSFYIAGGLSLVFVLLPGLFCDFEGSADEQLKQYDWLLSALREDRASTLQADALRSFFFILLAFLLLFAWLKNKLKAEVVLPLLALLILFDMWGVDKRYLANDEFVSKSKADAPFETTAADQQILQDKGYFRVMNTSVSTFNDAGTSYFHHSIGGYHGAKLKRYQELIEYQISKGNMRVLNMLNAKYFISRDQQSNTPVAQINPGAMGPAWFVDDWTIVPDADAEMKALDSLDTRISAVVDARYGDALASLKPGSDSTASVRLVIPEGGVLPNYLKYETQSNSNRLLIFSEVHYPAGWNAYLDGKQVDYIRANYVLRAMVVPSGKHTVEFKFEPETYATGERISLAGSIILLLLVGSVGVMEWRKRA